MELLNFKNIIVFLLALLVINSIVGWFIPQGISYDQLETEIRLHDIEQEKLVLEETNDRLQFKINTFKDERIKIDSVVDGYNNNQIDSFYTDFFSR